jgi:hypothetical protein
MALYAGSSLTDAAVLSFDPNIDQLAFDSGVSPAYLIIDGSSDDPPFTSFSFGGKTVTLDGANPFALASPRRYAYPIATASIA